LNRAWASRYAAQALARTGDPSQALTIALTIHGDNHKIPILREVVDGFIRAGDPSNALTAAQTITDGFDRALALNSVAAALIEAGELGKAAGVARLILEMFNTTAEERARRPSPATVAGVFVQIGEIDQALAFADDATGDDRIAVLRVVARGLARAGDVVQALTIVNGIADSEQKGRALHWLIDGLVEANNLDRALAVANGMAGEDAKVHALVIVAKGYARARDFDRAATVSDHALANAANIRDHKARALALIGVMRVLALVKG
jgi:hypothetical protein